MSAATARRVGAPSCISCATGWAVSEGGRRRGFAEELRLNFELGVTAVFDTVRWLVRRTLRVPQDRGSPALQGALPGGPDEGARCCLLCMPHGLMQSWCGC